MKPLRRLRVLCLCACFGSSVMILETGARRTSSALEGVPGVESREGDEEEEGSLVVVKRLRRKLDMSRTEAVC